jgi:hypothetical protein
MEQKDSLQSHPFGKVRNAKMVVLAFWPRFQEFLMRLMFLYKGSRPMAQTKDQTLFIHQRRRRQSPVRELTRG